MKKIMQLNNIESGPDFYNRMIMVYKNNTLLFISEKNYEVMHEIHFDNWHPLDVIDGKLLMHKNDLFIYNDAIKDFVLYQSSKDGGTVSIFKDKIIENKYDRESNCVQISLFEKNNEIWKSCFTNRRGKRIIGEYLYVTDLSLRHIDFIDEHTGNIQKTLDFENPQISRFIYYYDNILILSLEIKPLEEYQLLGLDAGTGEEKWRIEHANFMYIQDPETGYLYDIGGKRFNVINPLEGKVIYQCDMTSENEKFGVIPEWGILGKDGIYFMDNFPRSKVGFINFNTHKIDFVLDLEFDAGIKIMKMVYHNGRLYILDTNETLHIFAE